LHISTYIASEFNYSNVSRVFISEFTMLSVNISGNQKKFQVILIATTIFLFWYLKIVKIKCQAKTKMPHRGRAFDSAFLSWVI